MLISIQPGVLFLSARVDVVYVLPPFRLEHLVKPWLISDVDKHHAVDSRRLLVVSIVGGLESQRNAVSTVSTVQIADVDKHFSKLRVVLY